MYVDLYITGLPWLLEVILAPVLPFFEMGRQAAPVTVVCMIIGIRYSGALIISETSSGKMVKKRSLIPWPDGGHLAHGRNWRKNWWNFLREDCFFTHRHLSIGETPSCFFR